MIRPGVTPQDLNKLSKGTMAEHLEIEFLEVGSDFLVAKMPVNEKTKQPMGLLHGGASVALAETIGSVAAYCVIDLEKQHAVGLEINANHIRGVTKGFVFAKAMSLHIGKTTQIWEIKITNEQDKLVCVSRITMAILDKK
jgi:1,4-dihydroxy-2-naphthoyl-CoA hydrolase